VEKKLVVIGVGNILMGDDGLGVRVVELLRQESLPRRVSIIDGGTAGIDLLYMFDGADYVVLIDCLDAGEVPGASFRLPWAEISDSKKTDQLISLHDLDLWGVLSLAERLNRLPTTVIFGAQPERIALGQGLSPAVTAAVPVLVRAVVREIDQVYSILD
jgi:hydrogenase maturation protease